MSEKSTSEKLYAYLKSRYGVDGTESFDKHEIHPKQIQIDIPGVRKNNEDHKWIAILELQGKEKTKCLIIGEEWPDDSCAWSRYLEIKDNNANLEYSWFSIITTMHLNKDFEFKTLNKFFDVLEDFVKICYK